MLHLTPPLFPQGDGETFRKSGRTVSVTSSPRDGAVAIYPSSNSDTHLLNAERSGEQPIFFATRHLAPSSERRTFITDTSIIFAALRNLWNVAGPHHSFLRSEASLKVLRKLGIDFVNHCKECWSYCSEERQIDQEPLQLNAEHYRKLCTCMSLFCLLYLPEPDLDQAPVAEELMEWLNTYYVEPSTDEGKRLTDLDRPWEDEYFWPFLQRAILRGLSKASTVLLDLLSSHPSTHLQSIAEHLIPLLYKHPRFPQFATEQDFVTASRRWKDKVKALRIELDRVPEDGRDDGYENWWERLSDVIGVMEGRAEVLKRLCIELGADWKEYCIVYSIYIDPRLRRQDLPEVALVILDEMPPDPTNVEEAIHSSLFLGKLSRLLPQALTLDPWLSTHLAELLEPLELIDASSDDSGLTPREYYVLSYVDYLQSDPGLWRLAVTYLCSCGDIGKEMADQILIHVPLRLQRHRQGEALTEEDIRLRAGDLVGVLKDVNEACFHHQREAARRTICKIAARTFLSEKEYGLAISYSTSAEDWAGLGRIVERVLEEYINQGPARFAHLVANIAPSLHTFRKHSANGIFIYRLEFAVRFAEFHHRRLNDDLENAAIDLVSMLRDGIAPKTWWAVALYDAVELLQNSEVMLFTSDEACVLLRKLEEICSRVTQGSGPDYLPIFTRVTRSKDEKHALQKLQAVRLALAKYYARCSVIGVGGRTNVVS